MSDIPAELPQSNALAEASPDSLSLLLSKDPEEMTRSDRTRVVEALRAQRARWQTAQVAKASAGPKAPKATRSATSILQSTVKVEDLGGI